MKSQFAIDVKEGLEASPKKLSSKYFYDDKGDKIFQKIMVMPTYYVTNAEYQVLQEQSEDIVKAIDAKGHLNVYELGAEDGTKTILFLRALTKAKVDFTYYPIDISADVLITCKANILQAIPEITVEPLNLRYDDAVAQLDKTQQNLVLFLGSNLGNLYHSDAIIFLRKIANNFSADDRLMMGLDKIKDPATILAAYNDNEGVTRDFNLNLLERINRELGGDFDLTKWEHWPVYNPERGTCTSYLVSTQEQKVTITALGMTFSFAASETIHIEISQKYSEPIVKWLCDESGLELENVYTDSNAYFLECIIKKKVGNK